MTKAAFFNSFGIDKQDYYEDDYYVFNINHINNELNEMNNKMDNYSTTRNV